MKIFVVPRHWVEMFHKDNPFFKENNFISIGEYEGGEGVSADGDNILKLVFEDISDKEEGKLFSDKQAKMIKEFVDRIDWSKPLYVNCAAGISRSGAVGSVLNDYVNFMMNNGEKNDDWFRFHQINSKIRPNAYVSRVLKKELGFYA